MDSMKTFAAAKEWRRHDCPSEAKKFRCDLWYVSEMKPYLAQSAKVSLFPLLYSAGKSFLNRTAPTTKGNIAEDPVSKRKSQSD
jgi:hypothetical protein